jgi:hypothetical protein
MFSAVISACIETTFLEKIIYVSLQWDNLAATLMREGLS